MYGHFSAYHKEKQNYKKYCITNVFYTYYQAKYATRIKISLLLINTLIFTLHE
jgi:hypothetical protein